MIWEEVWDDTDQRDGHMLTDAIIFVHILQVNINSNVVNFARNDWKARPALFYTIQYNTPLYNVHVPGHFIPWCVSRSIVPILCALFPSLCVSMCWTWTFHASHELAHMTEWARNTNIQSQNKGKHWNRDINFSAACMKFDRKPKKRRKKNSNWSINKTHVEIHFACTCTYEFTDLHHGLVNLHCWWFVYRRIVFFFSFFSLFLLYWSIYQFIIVDDHTHAYIWNYV